MKTLTVGEVRAAIAGLPDDAPVIVWVGSRTDGEAIDGQEVFEQGSTLHIGAYDDGTNDPATRVPF